MKPPYVVWNGLCTAIVLAGGGYLTLQDGLLAGKPGPEWEVLPWAPVSITAGVYNGVICGKLRTQLVEKSLRTLLGDPAKTGTNITRSTIMARAAKAPADAVEMKGQDAAAPATEKVAKAAKAQKAAAPAAKKTPAATKAAAAAAEKAATKPAKQPAKTAKNEDAGEGRKGRPSSLDVSAKLKKGTTKLDGTVREGTVREALMKTIIGGIGSPLEGVLGQDATGQGHIVKSVDVHFAINAGYVTL